MFAASPCTITRSSRSPPPSHNWTKFMRVPLTIAVGNALLHVSQHLQLLHDLALLVIAHRISLAFLRIAASRRTDDDGVRDFVLCRKHRRRHDALEIRRYGQAQ